VSFVALDPYVWFGRLVCLINLKKLTYGLRLEAPFYILNFEIVRIKATIFRIGGARDVKSAALIWRIVC
jgi:hypothetical protein